MTKKYKIPPTRSIVTIVCVATILSCCLLVFFEPDYIRSGGARKSVPLELAPILGLWLLFYEWKTVYLEKDAVYIRRYPFFVKKKIDFDRISYIEFAERSKDEKFVLIILDNCVSFSESKYKNVKSYFYYHPIKVIAIRLEEKNDNEWIMYFDDLATMGYGRIINRPS